jgi:hypothetical protein
MAERVDDQAMVGSARDGRDRREKGGGDTRLTGWAIGDSAIQYTEVYGVTPVPGADNGL